MTYNLEAKKGRVTKGETKADDGFYTGKELETNQKKHSSLKTQPIPVIMILHTSTESSKRKYSK